MQTDSSRQLGRCNNGETTVFYGVSHFSVPAKQSTHPHRLHFMSYTPQIFEFGGEQIHICESNRLTVFVRNKDVDGLGDLRNILEKLVRSGVNAIVAYIPPRVQSDYGWAIYRNGIEELSREELIARGVKLAPMEKYERQYKMESETENVA